MSSKLTPAPIDSIAVLPLRNLSGDPEQDYFADGMTEALMTDLAKIGALKVISRSSIMRYKGTDKPLEQIARELDVDVLIEGSALRIGDRVRITALLIDPETNQALWADRYEQDLQDVLLLQSEVAQAIATQIQVAVTPEESERLASARPINPEAHEAYLKGIFHWQKLTPQDLDTALSYFELALTKDPDYALGYLGIARVWGGRNQMGYVPTSEAAPKSQAAILKALELDDSLAEAHRVLAGAETWGKWDWPSAERAFERAIELNPNDADSRAYYSHFLNIVGRPDEAMTQIERALELDPFNALYRALYGVDLNFARRYDDAIAEFRKALTTSPNMPFALNTLAKAFHHKAMYEEALDAQRSYLAAIGHREGEEALTRRYADGGYTGAMRRVADAVAASSLRTQTRAYIVAGFYARAGDKKRALEWLERAFANRDPGMPYLRMPEFDSVREDPRFQDLLRRMKLPE